MGFKPLYGLFTRITILCAMSVFFVTQSFALAHAASHGESHHENEDVAACCIVAMCENQQAILPVVFHGHRVSAGAAPIQPSAYHSAAYSFPQGRAPPPRAPPAKI